MKKSGLSEYPDCQIFKYISLQNAPQIMKVIAQAVQTRSFGERLFLSVHLVNMHFESSLIKSTSNAFSIESVLMMKEVYILAFGDFKVMILQ